MAAFLLTMLAYQMDIHMFIQGTKAADGTCCELKERNCKLGEMADGFFEMLASDLRLLADEAKRAEGIGYHLVSMFSSSDHPNIVESCDRAQAKLRALSLAGSGRSMESIRSTPELLRPFINACQFKNGKLVSLALSSFQKFAANKGVNAIGRGEIISALSLVCAVLYSWATL
ncbi:uncharacterized protein HaLaN_28743 [Haematococcus lacustris]|uniref:Mon2/Sec7/BIG1-like dimerisation and cyclophilin-binding domain-containing protein n=1 Tax=Haematococcus lacustris TaxID=44745 RepID=A0A6A0ACH7_HAELA|nr:uncharacterized protein HaLaN_28743 [Haematococcus lacustris]